MAHFFLGHLVYYRVRLDCPKTFVLNLYIILGIAGSGDNLTDDQHFKLSEEKYTLQSVMKLEYFHGMMPQESATTKLLRKHPGAYFLRQERNNDIVISYKSKVDNQIIHNKISGPAELKDLFKQEIITHSLKN